jgi:phosphoglycolate phosphatase
MPATAKQLVDAANAVVPKISGKEAQEMVANGAVLVDIRDSAELAQTGKAAKFRRVLREVGASPSSVIAIGDEIRDIEAARKSGLKAGAVSRARRWRDTARTSCSMITTD